MAPDPDASHHDLVERVIASAEHARILVLGDLMLDEYVHGAVARLSPEAPVPIVAATERSATVGGAANVAAHLAGFGVAVSLVGVVGRDEAGAELLASCEERGIATDRILVVDDRPTTRKQRIVAGRSQVVRIDWESTDPVAPATLEALRSAVMDAPVPDVIVISDYAKGVVEPALVAQVVSWADRHGVAVLVDPKRAALDRYRGATLLKANQIEFEAAIGQELGPLPELQVAAPARQLMAAIHLEQVVITLGARGMVAVDGLADEHPLVLPQHAKEVYDVSGAGDTVLAVLALGRVAGLPLGAAAQLANVAAGLVVGRAGVATIGPSDLRDACSRRPQSKVVGASSLGSLVHRWRSEGRRIVFANGCFDLLHAGHLHLLQAAAERGDVLIVAVNSDASTRKLKGADRPLVSESDRAAALAALDCVDAVVIFDEADPGQLIAAVVPDVLVKGEDYRDRAIVGRDVVEAAGGTVELVSFLEGWSTTHLAAHIREGLQR